MSDSVQPMDWNLPVPLPMEMSQARKLQRVAISSSRGLLTQGSNFHLLHWQVDSLPLSHQGSTENPLNINYLMYLKCYSPTPGKKVKVSVTQSSPTLWNPMDYGLPGSSVHGILQARILEWVAIPFSRGSLTQGSNPGRQILYHQRHQPWKESIKS